MEYERSDETAGRLVGRVADHLTNHSTGDAEFDALLDDGRIVAAREHREYRLRAGIEELECATWIGLLIDLAEHGKQVRLNTTGGETLCGAVDGVGQDVATLRNGSHTVVVSFSAITTADTLDNEPQSPLASDRPARELTLVGILRNLASDDRSRLAAQTGVHFVKHHARYGVQAERGHFNGQADAREFAAGSDLA